MSFKEGLMSSSMTISGIASGLDVNAIIDATISANSTRLNNYKTNQTLYNRQQSAYKTIETKLRSFDSTIQTLTDSKMIYAFDLFDRKNIEASDNSVANVSVGQGAQNGTTEIEVLSLATPPKMEIANFAKPITSQANLRDIGVIEEEFGFAFVTDKGGITISATVTAEDTLENYVKKLNEQIEEDETLSGEITLSVDENGVPTFDFSGVSGGSLNPVMTVGSSKSNFADVFGLEKVGDTLVGKPKNALDMNGKLSDNGAGIVGLGSMTLPETINIGGFEIEITEDMTLKQLMNKVNDKAECQVSMSYDQTSNTMVFKAKDEFYSDYIYFSGNAFLSGLGITDSNGVVDTSKQIKRQNGEIKVNGKSVSIKSNKVTAAETGLQGVTINLKSTTDPTEPLKVSVSDNTQDLTKAIENFVGAYNALKSTIDQYTYVDLEAAADDTKTDTTGCLSNDYSLNTILTTLSSKITGTVVDDNLAYKAMPVIGFSMKDGELTFDKDKFLNAFNTNPEDVKALIVGTKDSKVTGVLETVRKQVKDYLERESGFFAIKSSSLATSIKDLNSSIISEEKRLEEQRQRLVKQYSQLDSLMSKYQSQSAYLS